jgi:hypothetical protein
MDEDVKKRLKHMAVDRGVAVSALVVEFILSGMRRAKTAPPPPHHPEPPPVPSKRKRSENEAKTKRKP